MLVLSFVYPFLLCIGGELGTLSSKFKKRKKSGDSIIRVEVQEIMKEYMQVYRDLQKVDVIVLQQIEKKLEDIFAYCKNHNLEIYIVMDYDFDLRFIITKSKSHYIRLNGGEINMFMPWGDIAGIDKETEFLRLLDLLLLRIKGIDGVNEYIRNISKIDVIEAAPECPPDLPINFPQDDDFF